jgi:soluble lytic murein transglycosylase-like protein
MSRTGKTLGRRASAALLAAILVLCGPVAALADVYVYTDQNGDLHFTNVPEKPRYKLWYRSRPQGKRSAKPGPAGRQRSSGPPEFDQLIAEAARKYALSERLLRAIILVESSFDPASVSPAGAEGLMQLMPATSVAMQVADAFDPRQNIMGGARYLRLLADRFNGDLVLIIAAYHAGEQAVQRYRGVPPYPNTRRYLRRVLERYYSLSADNSGS